MVSRHLLDSIAILPVVREVLASTANKTESDNSPHVLDIGSGAGLPGIPLAIADRGIDVMMIDSAARKTRFVQQAIADLGLGNASVLHRPDEFTLQAVRRIEIPGHTVTRHVALCKRSSCV